MTSDGNRSDMPQAVSQAYGRQYAPRFVRTPRSELLTLDRTLRRLGTAASLLAVPTLSTTTVLPYFAVPDGAPAHLWIQLGGIIAGATACGTAGSVLSTRRAIRGDYLDLWTARSARAGLAGASIASLVGTVVAVALLGNIAWTSADEGAPAPELGVLVWPYLAALFVAMAVNGTCFVRLRPLLWAAPQPAAYRGYRIAPWEKRN